MSKYIICVFFHKYKIVYGRFWKEEHNNNNRTRQKLVNKEFEKYYKFYQFFS